MTGVHPRIPSHDVTIKILQGFFKYVRVIVTTALGENGETKSLVDELHTGIDVVHLDGAHRWL